MLGMGRGFRVGEQGLGSAVVLGPKWGLTRRRASWGQVNKEWGTSQGRGEKWGLGGWEGVVGGGGGL